MARNSHEWQGYAVNGPFDERLRKVEADGLFRRLRLLDSAQGPTARLDGAEVILFSSNDYLGLCAHPKVTAAAVECVQRYGWGAGAARLLAGSMAPHMELERQMAQFLGKEAALLFNTGYAVNTGVLAAMMGRGDLIFADKLAHASIIDGARQSGAKLVRFAHNDPDSLEKLLAKAPARGRRLVVTEGVFSMDGDIPPLKRIADIARRHGAMLMVDDAHGFGLFGPQGRGTIHMAGIADEVDIHVVTLGKAMGGFGGVVAASRRFIDGLINFCRPFIYSTAIPPAAPAAALAALNIIRGQEGDKLRGKLFKNADMAVSLLREAGLAVDSKTQIVPVVVGESKEASRLAAKLLEGGVYAPAIRPPTVPRGTARLRLSITSGHTEADIKKLGTLLA
ncbi:MAG: 8-amino-7-oxononanoate synthase [Nitrospinota bacterium]|nr:8-amino-7-oxononanoate synthase [Nitrospinota bacterium]